ncbi:Sialic acid TRAP transporter permease protein SiaT [subsurface metagenome]
MSVILFISFFLGIIINMPIAFAIGMASVIALTWQAFVVGDPISFSSVVQGLSSGLDGFIILCVPFFFLAGEIMRKGSIARRIFRFFNIIVGPARGGLAYVNVLVSMVFAGITGAAVADTSAVGKIIIPEMIDEGYDPDFTVSLTAFSSTIGIIIPPSIPIVFYCVVTNTSVIGMFLAGIIPGLLLGILQMLLVASKVKKENFKVHNPRRLTIKEALGEIRSCFFALLMPIIMIGGIVGGIFTPTEGAAVAVAYGFIVDIFFYKGLKLSDMPNILKDTLIGTGVVLIIVSNATLYGWLITFDQLALKLSNALLDVTQEKFVLLALILLIYFIFGLFMGVTTNILILVPIFLPIVQFTGINMIHFGIITVVALSVGLVTPPYGLCLFVACDIANREILQVMKSSIQFIVITFILIILMIIFPQIVLFLPKLAGF